MNQPILIERDGHRTWLKWHRARRRASDPVFTGERIIEAMRLGASIEVDLIIHADHGCAVLHDRTLERETTGTGRVRDTSAAALRQLHLRDNGGQPIASKVMLLEDLCALLAHETVHRDALLQLDFKEDLQALTPQVVAGFGASVSPIASSVILSGGDFDAIAMLAGSAPGLRTGYDPCHRGTLAQLKASGNYLGFIEDARHRARCRDDLSRLRDRTCCRGCRRRYHRPHPRRRPPGRRLDNQQRHAAIHRTGRASLAA